MALIEYFSALVAAAEREACAKVADAVADSYGDGRYGREGVAEKVADAIRTRNTNKETK